MFESRYERKELLGKGGMGEVVLCEDRVLGREVAVKISKSTSANVREMFVREARIQGQLEHPAIVPVYDSGSLDDGRLYFVMKRVRGTVLSEILDSLRAGDPAAKARYGRAKLLGAFVSACRAIDFAHSKDVVHRDLKPANIMLGDFGEVYVLDWGVMKLVGDAEPGGVPTPDPKDRSAVTTVGGMFGTPGYMAPEQLEGGLGPIAARTDVYSLGVILFEILTLEPFRPWNADILQSSTTDVPPELAAIVQRAVAREIADRWPTVRAMADALDRFLEGDRDIALRKARAADHLDNARSALWRATAPGFDEHEQRARALRDATRAMALAPDSEATNMVLRVLLEPTHNLPAEAAAALKEDWIDARRISARLSVVYAMATMLFLSCLGFLGIRNWILLGVGYALTATAGFLGWRSAKGRPDAASRYWIMATWLGLAVVMTRLFGPLFFAPTIVLAIIVPLLLPDLDRARPIMLAGVLLLPAVMLFEVLGLFPPSYFFDGDLFCIRPQLTGFPPTSTLAILFALQLGTMVTLLLQVTFIRERFLNSERNNRLHVWYLKRLLR